MAIYCALRARGARGALIGGLCFILPGLVLIIAAGAAVLAVGAPRWLLGAALGASAAVPALALRAGTDLLRPSYLRTATKVRWIVWVIAGLLACLLLGPALIFVLLACGFLELAFSRARGPRRKRLASFLPAAGFAGVLGPLSWTALKVGALSFGGGFVIIPLIQADAVTRHHWMSKGAFLAAVALGQITPGPVVQTIAVVGYAAAGVVGALLAAFIAFAPSFAIVIGGGPYFDRLRASSAAQAFLAGAGPAAIGAILATVVLLSAGITHLWQIPFAVVAAIWILALRKSPFFAVVTSGICGAVIALLGATTTL